MSTAQYATLGALVFTGVVWLAKWWISRSLDARFERREREEREYREEQVKDAIRQQRGQQVMTNSLLVILQHMIYGNHVENLERAQKDLQTFRAENEAAILEKATKYNLR